MFALSTASTLRREYIYAGSALLARFDTVGGTTTTTYSHPDHLSARLETNDSGTVTRTFGHVPFGDSWYETGTADKFKFTSYERDMESGLDYAMARFDSSRLGRFMSADPLAGSISNPQSLNHYSYVQNDPINLADPSGMGSFTICLFDSVGNCIASFDLGGGFIGSSGGLGTGPTWHDQFLDPGRSMSGMLGGALADWITSHTMERLFGRQWNDFAGHSNPIAQAEGEYLLGIDQALASKASQGRADIVVSCTDYICWPQPEAIDGSLPYLLFGGGYKAYKAAVLGSGDTPLDPLAYSVFNEQGPLWAEANAVIETPFTVFVQDVTTGGAGAFAFGCPIGGAVAGLGGCIGAGVAAAEQMGPGIVVGAGIHAWGSMWWRLFFGPPSR